MEDELVVRKGTILGQFYWTIDQISARFFEVDVTDKRGLLLGRWPAHSLEEARNIVARVIASRSSQKGMVAHV